MDMFRSICGGTPNEDGDDQIVALVCSTAFNGRLTAVQASVLFAVVGHQLYMLECPMLAGRYALLLCRLFCCVLCAELCVRCA